MQGVLLALQGKGHVCHILAFDQHTDPARRTIGELDAWCQEHGVGLSVMEYSQGGPENYQDRLHTIIVSGWNLMQVIEDFRADTLLLFGDRIEVPMMALMAHNHPLRPLIVHVQGGDITGGLDDAMRDATTKLAHLHFTSTEQARQRLIAMGERTESVLAVGDPHLDSVKRILDTTDSGFVEGLGLVRGEYFVVLVHPETDNPDAAEGQILSVLAAVYEVGLPLVLIYPCNDLGHEPIIKQLEQASKLIPEKSLLFKHLQQANLVALMRDAAAVIGNSSMGLIEAPFIGTQAVNLGTRQRGRAYNGEWVTHLPFETNRIEDHLNLLLDEGKQPLSPDKTYGDGRSGARIASLLETMFEFRTGLKDKRRAVMIKELKNA